VTGIKSGARALGIAESYSEKESTLAGVVVRANRVVDGIIFGSCTVGGIDATDTICSLVDRLDREDIQYILVAGIAPAWFNIVDLHRLHEDTGIPVLSVTFEESDGLAPAITDAFDDPSDRLEIYQSQPDRHPVTLDADTLYVRQVGLDEETAATVVRAFTPEGGRPEPVRVARLAARGADEFRRT